MSEEAAPSPGSKSSHLCSRHLVAIWVHGWQQVDAGGVQQALDAGVAQQVLRAQILGQVDEHLPSRHLVAMDVANELHLGLHCREKL